MRLRYLLMLAGLGYVALRVIERSRNATTGQRALAGGRPTSRHHAFAGDELDPRFIRPAGAEAMRDPPPAWDGVDEASDESFPASDPPGRY